MWWKVFSLATMWLLAAAQNHNPTMSRMVRDAIEAGGNGQRSISTTTVSSNTTTTTASDTTTDDGDPRCTNVDIRNDLRRLKQIENCTVINGFLQMVLIERVPSEEFEKYSCKHLRCVWFGGWFLFYFVLVRECMRSISVLHLTLEVIESNGRRLDPVVVICNLLPIVICVFSARSLALSLTLQYDISGCLERIMASHVIVVSRSRLFSCAVCVCGAVRLCNNAQSSLTFSFHISLHTIANRSDIFNSFSSPDRISCIYNNNRYGLKIRMVRYKKVKVFSIKSIQSQLCLAGKHIDESSINTTY